jgi:hypothetical protein
MERHSDHQTATKGKVLRFRMPGPKRGMKASEDIAFQQARVLELRRKQAGRWIAGAWVVLAWTVSILRLRLAVTHHEVFGLETSLALVVVVWMPLMHMKSIVVAVREGAAALRLARHRDAEPTAATTRPPAANLDRSGRRLQ